MQIEQPRYVLQLDPTHTALGAYSPLPRAVHRPRER